MSVRRAGAVMVHSGNVRPGVPRRLVAQARASDPAAIAARGNRLSAALLDFGRNLLLGVRAVLKTIVGVSVLVPCSCWRPIKRFGSAGLFPWTKHACQPIGPPEKRDTIC
jgi:hypothetical protein